MNPSELFREKTNALKKDKKSCTTLLTITGQLKETNLLEWYWLIILRPMSCFNNSQSIERIIYAVLSHLNDQWRNKPLKEFIQKL